MSEQRWDADAWAALEQRHRTDLHAARLKDLTRVEQNIRRVQEQIRDAQIRLVDLKQARQDILADIEADARPAPDAAGPTTEREG